MKVDPKPSVVILSLLWTAFIVGALGGCSTTAPRAVDQPPITSQYKGWGIRVTPSVIYGWPNLWHARVRVWPPEVQPEAHPGINLSFNETATERSAVEQAANAAARRYIDGSLRAH